MQSLIEALKCYQSRHPQQTDIAHDFTTFLHENQYESFSRALAVGHVTASCWLLDESQSRVLLTHHKKLGRWLQLGGHADGECNVRKVAITEAYEESGLSHIEWLLESDIFDLDKHLIPENRDEAAHFHYDFRFAMRAMGSDATIVGDESHDLQWVPIERLAERTDDESILRMERKWYRMSI